MGRHPRKCIRRLAKRSIVRQAAEMKACSQDLQGLLWSMFMCLVNRTFIAHDSSSVSLRSVGGYVIPTRLSANEAG